MKIVVIDGQGGRIGKAVIEQLRARNSTDYILAVGTNSIATSAMLKAGADAGATGENPVVVASRDADVIIGPIGIIAADSMLGEITPKMAEALGQSKARKVLVPVNRCFEVAGVREMSLSQYVEQAAELALKN
ncbi:MAG: DUF3842 family protein [Spirochaetales bacterium]|nr:DUF3842 family protein [Spirochaetales bacterium]MBR6348893.1 DUF3842 family protein [Spirochaetales bacterium]